MHQYAGNPSAWLPTIGLLDDSDVPNASNLDTGPSGNADRTAYLHANTATMKQQYFTSSGTWVAPPGVTAVLVEMCGGGGGGGGGPGGVQAVHVATPGGVGGNGAEKSVEVIATIPGDTYSVTIGAGGIGGAGGVGGGSPTDGTVGGDGGSTGILLGLTVLAACSGGRGGPPGLESVSAQRAGDNQYVWSPPVQGLHSSTLFDLTTDDNPQIVGSDPVLGNINLRQGWGLGGAGFAYGIGAAGRTLGYRGRSSKSLRAGGSAGLVGVASSAYCVGGAGGGGGAGDLGTVLGQAPAGGNGGNGNDSGNGTNGTAGGNAANNTGSGGGGGGGGGGGSTGGGTGGAGGNGGSGFIKIMWTEYDVHPLG